MDPHHAQTDPDTDLEPPDRELIDRVRAGDLEAFDPLYRRHRTSALRHARYWTRSEAAAEDLSAESFTRVLYAIRNGNGPSEAFRPYLLTAMRNVARDWAEGERRTLLLPDLVDLVPVQEDQDPVIAALERSLAGLAFMSLPERWQSVLWQMEVEQEGPTQLGPQLGLEPAAVSALAYRAREGLKQAYLQAHITEIGSPSCRPFAERLGTHTRGKLRGREEAKVRGHLKDCAECGGLYAMLKYVNGNIHVLIAPAVVGGAAAVKGVALWTGGSAAAGAAGGGGAHPGVVAKLALKARSATPRQQAVAAGTTVAVIVAAVAYALSGSPPAAPQPAARPAPRPSSAAPSHPAPPPPPALSPSPTPKPVVPAPVVAPSSAPPRTPAPRPHTAAPPAPRPSPTPRPTPTPSPTQRVSCPNLVLGIDLNVGGLRLTVGLTDLGAAVDLGLGAPAEVSAGAAGTLARVATCSTAGPPRPFPFTSLDPGPVPDPSESASPGSGPEPSPGQGAG